MKQQLKSIKILWQRKNSPHKQRINMQWGLIDLNQQSMLQDKIGLKLLYHELCTKWQNVYLGLKLSLGSGTCQGLDIYCFRLWWAAVSGLCERCAEEANSLAEAVFFFQFTVSKQPHRISDHITDSLFFVYFVSNSTHSLVCFVLLSGYVLNSINTMVG